MSVGFKEAVIVPRDVFDRCNFREATNEDILYDANLPPDLKMKLYSQRKKLRPSESKYARVQVVKPPPAASRHKVSQDVHSILQHVSERNRPNASSILAKILHAGEDTMSWNDRLEMTINREQFPNSNIIDLLQYVLGEKIITGTADVPLAGKEFYTALIEMGVPSSLLRIRKSQVGRGWLSLYP